MKKRMVIAVLTLFMLSLWGSMVLAKDEGNKQNNGKAKVIQAKKEFSKAKKELQAKKHSLQIKKMQHEFVDVQKDWAREEVMEATVKGFVYGYEDFTFKPNAPVTNMETIVMILRAQGLAQAAENYSLSDEQKVLLKKIPDWGKNYVALALENGILNQDELQTFNPQQGAKRCEVCMYMARTLEAGSTLENQEKKVFTDEEQIPKVNRKEARLMWMNGIIKGYPDGSFNPMQVVKRNEIAVMLNKLDENCLQGSASFTVSGTIKEITVIEGGYAITVENENGESTVVNTNAQTKLFFKGTLVTSIDLSNSSRVKILLNQDQEAVLVRINDEIQTV